MQKAINLLYFISTYVILKNPFPSFVQDGASQFEKSAGKLKNKFWIENMKMIIIGGLIGAIILGVIYWKVYSPPDPYVHQYGAGAPGGAGGGVPRGQVAGGDLGGGSDASASVEAGDKESASLEDDKHGD